jgi:hypothetical protein
MKLNEISTFIKDKRAQAKGSDAEKKAAAKSGTKSGVLKHARGGLNKAVKMTDRKKAKKNPRKSTKHKRRMYESIEMIFEEQKKWTKEEIRDKINTDTRWLLRAVSAIYQKQTEDEQSSRVTNHANNVGFNGVDAEFLSQAAERYDSGFNFSEKYVAALRRAMLKYSGQLTKIANGKI